MNFKYTGLFISVLILLGMLITCHLRNYFNTSTRIHAQNNFINLAVPTGSPKWTSPDSRDTGTPPLKYNKISYVPGIQQIPCEIANQGNFPCSQIQTCLSPQTTKAEQLSDSELAILYKEAYERAALEIMKRTLEE